MSEKKISPDLSGIKNALTVNEVAELLGLSTRTIRNYIADGKLVGFKVGSQWRFTQESALKLIEESTASAAPAATAAGSASGSASDAECPDFTDGGAPVAYLRVCLPMDSEEGCAELVSKLGAVAEALSSDDADAAKVSGRYIAERGAACIECTGSPDVAAKLLKTIRKG